MPHAEWAIAPDLLRGYRRLLLNRTMPYALQLADGSYRWIDRRCRWQMVQAHLLGQQTIASSSLDASGWCRWICLDADAADGLPKLVGIAQALYDLGFPPVLEASRRGGHLWLFLEAPAPATLARRMTLGVLARLAADGVPMTPLEVYPETDAGLGHGVRLPLGVHQRTGQRYPLLDERGRPFRFTSLDEAITYLLRAPRVGAMWLRAQWAPEAPPPQEHVPSHGTRSPVIQWVDAEISPLDLLAEFAPEAAPRKYRRTWIAWCPFHDDLAPQADGSAGTPSLLLFEDERYGWSWRCLSSNCRLSTGPYKHSFSLYMELTGMDARSAIRQAIERWPKSVIRR